MSAGIDLRLRCSGRTCRRSYAAAPDRTRGCGQPYPRGGETGHGRAPASGIIHRQFSSSPRSSPDAGPHRPTYLSLGAFYASDPARRSSRERDVGLFWRSQQGPTFRAA